MPPRVPQGVVTCQHGPDECAMNRVINCAQRLDPQQARWFPFARCLEAAFGPGMAAAAPQCADAADLDWAAIDSCASGDRRSCHGSLSSAVAIQPSVPPTQPP